MALSAPVALAGLPQAQHVRVGASVGVAVSVPGSLDAERLVRDADAAAYRAKNAGRGIVEVFDDELRAVPALALHAWAGGRWYLLAAYVVVLAVAVRRAPRPVLVVGGAWLVLPLLAVQVLDLLRPVYVSRYLLPALLGADGADASEPVTRARPGFRF